MKVVIFCGGMGMRLRGYVDDVPKPMALIGTRPLIWHLMKYYAHFGHKDFILCLGYKGEAIKEYFLKYEDTVSNDFVWSDGGKKIEIVNRDEVADWRITFVDTGASSNIGERLKKVEPYLKNEDMFLANYGDGLSSLNLPVMIDEFKKSDAIGSLLLVQPTASFDIVNLNPCGTVKEILPLSKTEVWINGGFFVFRNDIFRYMMPGEELVREPFQRLIAKGGLLAYRADCFWQCMDTFKDKQILEELNHQPNTPWKVWGKTPVTFETGQ